ARDPARGAPPSSAGEAPHSDGAFPLARTADYVVRAMPARPKKDTRSKPPPVGTAAYWIECYGLVEQPLHKCVSTLGTCDRWKFEPPRGVDNARDALAFFSIVPGPPRHIFFAAESFTAVVNTSSDVADYMCRFAEELRVQASVAQRPSNQEGLFLVGVP